MTGIYVHIPFCEKKCIYCDFSSFVTGEVEKQNYFSILTKEILNCPSKGCQIDTIYFGGGTPSSVASDEICHLLNCIRSRFHVLPNAEITIECNPCSTTTEKLTAYFAAGVNRISFGVQSLKNDTLQFLGRLHTRDQALQAIALARDVGIENISADLLIGLPGATVEGLIEDASLLLDAGVQHISAYMLQVEAGTPLALLVAKHKGLLPSDDESVALYDALVAFLEQRKLHRYEISNFARAGFQSRHNIKYWTGDPYIGFGLGAHSYQNGIRKANANTFAMYALGKHTTEILTVKQRIEEKLMLGLRCEYGVSLDELDILGYDIQKEKAYQDFLNKGVLFEKDDRFYLDPTQYGVSNFIIVSLLPRDV